MLEKLREFGLEEYILFPQISWAPKGDSIRELVREFNIGPDAMAFIDDSPFEREQVRVTNPGVRIYEANDYQTLLQREEFNPPITTEASRRRDFYRDQKRRDDARVSFFGEYADFLKSCDMRLYIHSGSSVDLDRIHELVQRTNQLNFSGNRYNREQIGQIMEENTYDKYSVSCVDKFGDYGIIGFCVVQNCIPRMVDLMFSCRIQGKRVEHAFLCFLLERYKSRGFDFLESSYRMTDRNKAAGMAFEDMGFTELLVHEGVYLYEFKFERRIPNDGIITVFCEGDLWALQDPS